MADPTVSVVVVSDYGGRRRSWATERAVLGALAGQDFAEPFETVLVEQEAFKDVFPRELLAVLPGARVEFSPATTSAELKDEGVRRVSGELVAVIEADCTPAPDWLRHMVAALRKHPECAAVSGKTLYPGSSAYVRCQSLLDRSYLDPGGSGVTRFVCNNNSILPRAVLIAYPYPPAPSPFVSAGLRWEAMRRDDLRFYFQSNAVVYHALPGWSFIADMRRHNGYALSAQLGGRGRRTLRALAQRLYWDVKRCWRLRRHYAVSWYEMPLVFALGLVARMYELEGVRDARRYPDGVVATSYR
jgi:hypothetical protein